MLSEESIRKRHRQDMISLKMTMIAWTLEFITGSMLLINYVIGNVDNFIWKRIIYTLDMILCSCVIPCSYILKTEEIRKIVLDSGWCQPLRMVVSAGIARDAPVENLNMAVIPNAQPENIFVCAQNKAGKQHEQQEYDEDWLRRIDLFDEDSISYPNLALSQNADQTLQNDPVLESDDEDWLTVSSISETVHNTACAS